LQADWLAGCLAGWLFVRLHAWHFSRVACRLAGWQSIWQFGWQVRWLSAWLPGMVSAGQVVWQVGWQAG
jgi:hypothetical protein